MFGSISRSKTYVIKALTLLSQYYLILLSQLAEQVKWSRFISVHGLPGHNTSCDLHVEHSNQVAKIVVKGLGAKKSEKDIQRIGKLIGSAALSLEKFDATRNVSAESGALTTQSSGEKLAQDRQGTRESKCYNSRKKT